MALRDELLIKMPEGDKVQSIIKLTKQIISVIDNGLDCEGLLREMVCLTGKEYYDKEFFVTLHSHSSVNEFALEAALPVPPKVENISKEELIEIVRLAKEINPPLDNYYCQLFDRNVPMSGASNLIYYPEDWQPGQDLSNYDPSPEEIVEAAIKKSNVIQL